VTRATTATDALLDRCVDYLAGNGFSDLSLRDIAAGVGTSHRMLIYHFGSRDGLLTAMVGAMEARQRDALADLRATDMDPAEVCRAFWRRISDPSLAPAETLFFEVYAQALRGRSWTDGFRATVIAAWEAPLTELFAAFGFAPDDARHRARLALATARGLLLDLLMTGDRETVDAAAELFAPIVAAGPATGF
jgi:AcrR family transcriptional regulator